MLNVYAKALGTRCLGPAVRHPCGAKMRANAEKSKIAVHERRERTVPLYLPRQKERKATRQDRLLHWLCARSTRSRSDGASGVGGGTGDWGCRLGTKTALNQGLPRPPTTSLLQLPITEEPLWATRMTA